MTPATLLEYRDDLNERTSRPERLTLTDLARGKAWRSELPTCGVMEVADRSGTGTAAWLVSEEYMDGIKRLVSEALAEREQSEIRAMLDARSDYEDWRSGEDLAARAVASLASRREAFEAVVHGL